MVEDNKEIIISNVENINDNLSANPSMVNSKFLEDYPLKDPNQSKMSIHETIAKEISKEILNETRPSNIAIIGEWGSGKSTVLEFLKGELEKQEEVVFFVFDAWGHAGDALRKNFLLSLGRSIIEDNNANEVDEKLKEWWKEEKNRLLGTEKIETRIEQQKFSLFTSWLLSLVALYIVFQAILSSFGFLPGILSMTLSLLLTLFLSIKRKKDARNVTENAELIDKTGLLEKLEEFYSFIIGHPGGRVEQNIRKQPDLDSTEFESLYTALIEKVGTRKIIIAIDNLDRLSGEKIKNAWDSIQVFTSYNRLSSLSEKRPWIILPIARSAFIELAGKPSDDDMGSELGAISKLFVRQFEIPSPITTDWKTTFKGFLSMAFPEITDEDADAIFFIANTANTGRISRTPREAKRYINEMVAFSRLFKSISIISIALYCYYNTQPERKERDILQALADESAQDSESARTLKKHILNWVIDSEDCLNELAMLNFGLFEKEKAHEAFIYREIYQMTLIDEEPNISMIVHGRPGSWNILYDVLEKLLRESKLKSTSWYTNFLKAFFEYKPITEEEKASLREIQRLLIRYLPQGKWPHFSGFAELASLTLLDSRVEILDCERITEFIIKETNLKIPELMSLDQTKEIEDLIVETTIMLNTLDSRHAIIGQISINDMEDSYWYFLKVIIQNDLPADWLSKTTETSYEAFISICRGLIVEFKINGYIVDSIWRLVEIAPPVLKSNGQDARRITMQNEVDLIKYYMLFWIMKNVRGIVSPLVNSFLANYQIRNVNDFKNYSFLGMLGVQGNIAVVDFLLGQTNNRSYNELPTILLRELNDTISTLAKEYREICPSSFDSLLAALKNKDFKDLALALLKGMWKQEDYRNIEITQCLEMAIAMEPERRIYLGEELAKAGRINDLVRTEYRKDLISLYIGFSCFNSEKSFKEWIFRGLDQLNTTEWDISLESPNNSSVQLVVYCGQLPKKLEVVIVKRIEIGQINSLKGSKLLELIAEKHAIYVAITKAFDSDSAWKNLIKDTELNSLLKGWFNGLSVSERQKVVETIVRDHSVLNIKWLYDFLNSYDNPKSLFQGKIRELVRFFKSVEKLSDSTLPKRAKSACQNILNLLK